MANDKVQLFEDRPIRTAWVEDEEEWYFSVVDVVGMSDCLKHLDRQDGIEYDKDASERCNWFPCQAKWELYKMGTPPYKINGSDTRWEPYHIK